MLIIDRKLPSKGSPKSYLCSTDSRAPKQLHQMILLVQFLPSWVDRFLVFLAPPSSQKPPFKKKKSFVFIHFLYHFSNLYFIHHLCSNLYYLLLVPAFGLISPSLLRTVWGRFRILDQHFAVFLFWHFEYTSPLTSGLQSCK